MRIHLGHHFFGAGNLGDDFMLAGFLTAMTSLAPTARLSCCVPFPLEPLRRRFPAIAWASYNEENRTDAIAACDVWLGLGGSPFQSAQSRWFLDHLVGEAASCARAGKPMFFLGVGVQTAAEVAAEDVRRICTQARGIWTRDAASAARLRALQLPIPVETGADLAHLHFRATPPPPAAPGRLTLVANFDYAAWPGQAACLEAAAQAPARERVWLAQESRELPGAERALYSSLPPATQAEWRLIAPEIPGAPLGDVLARWPSGEWLITARYHAALAGAWSGSKVVVIATNEKLRSAASDLNVAPIAPDAENAAVAHALSATMVGPPPVRLAHAAWTACEAFLRHARAAVGS